MCALLQMSAQGTRCVQEQAQLPAHVSLLSQLEHLAPAAQVIP